MSDTAGAFNSSTALYLRRNLDIVSPLLQVDELFNSEDFRQARLRERQSGETTTDDLDAESVAPDNEPHLLSHLENRGVVERVERNPEGQHSYVLVDAARDRLQELQETRDDTMPCCGASPNFVNDPTDGDEPPYRCKCGLRHPREIIEELL